MASCRSCNADYLAGTRWCSICRANVLNPELGRLASPVKRLGAYVIDVLIFWVFVWNYDKWAFNNAPSFVLIVVYVFFSLILFAKGFTIGKKLLGMRVVKEDGGQASFFVMLIREWIGKIISGLVLTLGLLWILYDKENQGWHDKLLRTCVVSDISKQELSEDREDQDESTEEGEEIRANLGCGFLIFMFTGIIVIFGSFILLGWNEFRAVETSRSREEGERVVVAVTADKVDSGNDGKLVHLSEMATTDETISDPVFNVSGNAILLRRSVEMYQWKETIRDDIHSYTRVWSPWLLDSSNFEYWRGHENPEAMPYENRTFSAHRVKLGAFTLPRNLALEIGGARKIPAADSHIPADLSNKAQVYGGRIYVGGNPSAPEVGDVRISHEVVKPQAVSLIARQSGSSFEPYRTSVGEDIYLLKTGTHSADSMFLHEMVGNTLVSTDIRDGGFLLMFLGFGFVLVALVCLAANKALRKRRLAQPNRRK